MKTMMKLIAVSCIFSLISCSNSERKQIKTKSVEEETIKKTEVIVLGMIHGKHSTSKKYGVKQLKEIITEIQPDAILTEIPPDRFFLKLFQQQDGQERWHWLEEIN